MTKFHPSQIERARQSVTRHDAAVPAHVLRVSRVIQWIILRDSRPATNSPRGEIIPFKRPSRPLIHIGPRTPSPGGAAA